LGQEIDTTSSGLMGVVAVLATSILGCSNSNVESAVSNGEIDVLGEENSDRPVTGAAGIWILMSA
jgi:hypothetical protein